MTEGVYLVDGQEVSIEWRHSTEPGQRGCPIVVDGPMRQPLVDYLKNTEENKEFDLDAVVCTTALHQVPKDQRMTFDDKHKQYSRLEAMKVAKEQASIREEAADYTLDGKQVPDDLVRRYNKVLRTKVRGSRSKEDAIRAQEQHVLAAQVKAETKAEKIEPVKSEAGHFITPCTPLRQPSPLAMRMAAQAMAVKPEAPKPSSSRCLEPATLAPFPTVSMMTRGISLNGVPSYVPTGSWQPPLVRVTRSWSGSCITPESVVTTEPNGPSSVYMALPQAQVVASVPQPALVRQVSVVHANEAKVQDVEPVKPTSLAAAAVHGGQGDLAWAR